MKFVRNDLRKWLAGWEYQNIEGRTGRMVTRIVESRAARNETSARVAMADTVFFGGFQPGGSVNIGIGDGISERSFSLKSWESENCSVQL